MLLFSICIVILFICIAGICRDIKKPAKFPPGPVWYPVVGNLFQVINLRKSLGFHHLVWNYLSKYYGAVVGLRMGRNYVAIVSSCDGIREVFTRDEFSGRPDGFFFRFRTFGKRLGIVFTDGQLWQKQRRFSLHHLKQFGYGRRQMEDGISLEVKDLIGSITKRCEKTIDVHNLFDVCVINVLWGMIAGQRFNCDDDRLRKLMDIIHDAFRSRDASGGLLNQMPFLRFLAPELSGFNNLRRIHERMWNFLKETVSIHKESLCAAGHERDLIDAFLLKMYNNKTSNDTEQNADNLSFTDEQLLSVCLDMFMAGSETTSNTLEFIVLYMIRYPEVQRKVQDEMDNIIGSNCWPSLQDRNRLPYLDAVINEVQRCSNIAPMGIAHRTICDVELLGHKLPEGTTILTNLYSLHMDVKFWKDPHTFRPERFLQPGNKQAAQDAYFVPFGYGQRRCLGETLAKANLFLVTSTLFHNFTVTIENGNEAPTMKALDGITLSPLPYQARFIQRNT